METQEEFPTFKYAVQPISPMQDRIFQLLVEQNDVTWKSIILDLIPKEQMNPWDVDISLLTKKYIERLHELKESDLQLSGKVILAAAVLLKIKSKRLVGEDLNEFDRLLAQGEITEDQFYADLEAEQPKVGQIYPLIPRTPQARTRKVSVHDLVEALEKALEVKHRRLLRLGLPNIPPLPMRQFDVIVATKQLYKQIREWYISNQTSLTFQDLTKNYDRKQTVYAFIPLLQLCNDRKINLNQDQPFGDIGVRLNA